MEASPTRLFEPLTGSLEPVTLHRPMQLYKRTLRLTSGAPGVPCAEGLMTVILGFAPETFLRGHLGEAHYKTFQNARLGRHRPSATSVATLRRLLGEAASVLFSDAEDGEQQRIKPAPPTSDNALLPELRGLVATGMTFLEGLRDAARTCAQPRCPHCRHLLIQEPEAWWNEQGIAVSAPAQRLADRLIGLVVFIERAERCLASLRGAPLRSGGYIDYLEESRSPMGHWLERYGRLVGCSNLGELSGWLLRRGVRLFEERRISHDLLRRWAGRQHLITARATRVLLDAAPQGHGLSGPLTIARWLTFIVDFVHAAADHPAPSWVKAQAAVRRRYEYLSHAERLRRAKSLRPVGEPPLALP